MSYLVPLRNGAAEYVEKRSRFIGQVWPVTSEAEARELIAATKAKYYDARHNCWCFIIRDGGLLRYADDGEPQGTAGQPMLEVFRRGGIENVLCVVTRYFGGILLGAGGLTRAYAHTAKLALDAAGIAEMRPWMCLEFTVQYALFERFKSELDSFDGIVEHTAYGADVTITALLLKERTAAFCARMTDMTSGCCQITPCGEKYVAASVKQA